MSEIEPLLELLVSQKASDLFLLANMPPCAKISDHIVPLKPQKLSADRVANIVLGMMSSQEKQDFSIEKEKNFIFVDKNLGRFRVSAFYQRETIAAVLRRIQTQIPNLKDLNIPLKIQEFAMQRQGLCIIAGATGAGKSSTLAAMVDYRNNNSSGHIITVEDPIEFVHESKKSIITQREVGVDTDSFAIALKNALRQAPDVVLIGEIRNRETMEYAIQFSQTGHLCLTTIHANSADQAIDRIINFFPAEQKEHVCLDLSICLNAVVSQRLIEKKDSYEYTPVVEIMVATDAIRNSIRNNDIKSIKEYMQKDKNNMQTFDNSLFDLYVNGGISYENALQYADSKSEFKLMLKTQVANANKPPASDNFILKD